MTTTQPGTSGSSFDHVALEIAWGRLQSIIDEAEATLIRTAFSPLIREGFDFGVVLLDGAGGSVTQSQRSMPSFVGTLPRTLKAALERFPSSSWQDGDVFFTNDPWLGTGHLPDITMVRPVFHGGRLVAYVGCIAHWADIGGAIWSADSSEVFEEGLQLPLGRLQSAGTLNEEIVAVVLANVRLPEQVLGDLHAQLATLEIGVRRLLDLFDDMGIDEPTPLFTEIQQRSEAAMRAAIAALPDGEYVHELEIDGVEDPLVLRATVVVEGDAIHVDWSGTSPQTSWAINETFNHAYAMTVYPIKCALCPDVPNNEGSYRPITMTAPEGCLVNARYPAAVASRQTIGHCVSAVVFGALAEVVPERVLADSGSPCPRIVFTGFLPTGDKWGTALTLSGGMGAQDTQDGLSAAPWPSNAGTTSVEIVEAAAPVVFRRRALIPDSGGAGRFRGGLGVATEIELASEAPCVVSIMTDRIDHPPLGRYGGHPGAPNRLAKSSGGYVHPKSRTALEPGEVVTLETAGGGGFGSPAKRDAALLARDVEFGYVTTGAAARLYRGEED
jgi:N-methylhydantoinase B